MTSYENILTVKNLCKGFKRKNHKITAGDHLNFYLKKGEILGIVGESGSGKSTLAKLLMHIEQPDHGEIKICGKRYSDLKGEELRMQRKNIQMIFQDPISSMNPKKRVKDIISEPLLNYKLIKKNQVHDKVVELLKAVELNETFLDKYPHSMSGGEAQRVAIARAISIEPQILLCDEATSALDVSVQKNIVDTLFRLNKELGISIIFISHDIFLTQFIANRIIVMKNGCIVETMNKDEFYTDNHMEYTNMLINSATILNKNLTSHQMHLKGRNII